jgi:nitrogen regulatory protein PII
MMTIVRREISEQYEKCLASHSVSAVLRTLCNGTAQKKVLEYLGLERTEKIMLISLASGDAVKKINRDFIYRLSIDAPGNGISLTVPLTGAGASAMKYLVSEEMRKDRKEVKDMNEMRYSLITVICERGGSDAVMDAARSAGAAGGTVVHAKGTADGELAKAFFGISIGSEKDIIYIVTKAEDKVGIMKAVSEKAGMATPTRAVVFSMPVDSVIGLKSLTEDAE